MEVMVTQFGGAMIALSDDEVRVLVVDLEWEELAKTSGVFDRLMTELLWQWRRVDAGR